jgi:hypothetical protein
MNAKMNIIGQKQTFEDLMNLKQNMLDQKLQTPKEILIFLNLVEIEQIN